MFFREFENNLKEMLLPAWLYNNFGLLGGVKKFWKTKDSSIWLSTTALILQILRRAHTNPIEGTQWAIKRDLPRKHDKNHFDSHLVEYMRRRLHNHLQTDEAFKEYYQEIVKMYTPSTTG